jgi:hypoxanthine-DNA glycosylase
VRQRGLAIWDVYAVCRREGSLDSAIEDAQPNDLQRLVARLTQLVAIAHNGGESARAMRTTRALGLPVHRLPSTSPANASWPFERKLAAWREVFAQSGLLTA